MYKLTLKRFYLYQNSLLSWILHISYKIPHTLFVIHKNVLRRKIWICCCSFFYFPWLPFLNICIPLSQFLPTNQNYNKSSHSVVQIFSYLITAWLYFSPQKRYSNPLSTSQIFREIYSGENTALKMQNSKPLLDSWDVCCVCFANPLFLAKGNGNL